MREIVVLSGKGGTGKTTVTAALAHLAARETKVVVADADVDAANLGLLLSPRTLAEQDFTGGRLAIVDDGLCERCGICLEACRFDAIHADGDVDGQGRYRVDPIACEGCAACFYRCPVSAIRLEEQLAGKWFVSATRFGTLVHAHLFAGQENSGKLVTAVKRQAREIAQNAGGEYLLVDGPPGIGCPVIAACSGANLALLVTEPTVAGIHDLERMLATTEHFRVPAVVCLNKHDLNPERSRQVERFCAEKGVSVVGRIPFTTAVTEAMVSGETVTEWADNHGSGEDNDVGAVAAEIQTIWRGIQALALGQ